MFDITADARRKFNRAKSIELSTRQRDLLVRLLETLRHGNRDQIDQLVRLCREDLSWDQLISEIYTIQSHLDIAHVDHDQKSVQLLSEPDTGIELPRKLQQLTPSSEPEVSPIEKQDAQPIFILPSAQWTNVTSDNELVSHLITLYFVWEHPTLPFLDRELFFEDLESGHEDFCSSLLVNAICALGSVCVPGPVAKDLPSSLH